MFIVYAGRDGSTTAATLPTGWTNVGTSSINGTSTADSVVRVACKVATTTSETVTGFTNAGAIIATIYRGQASGGCATAALGAPVFTDSTVNTTTTTETFGAATNVFSTSWDVGFGYAPAATGGIVTAPTGMTNRTSQGTIMGAHDTNGGVSSFSSANVTLTTAGRVITAVVEIIAPCSGRPCFVQAVESGGSSDVSDPTTYTSNVAVGDLLIAFQMHTNWSGTGTTTVSDNGGNTWHPCSGTGNGAFTDIQFATSDAISCNYTFATTNTNLTVTITASDCASNCTTTEAEYLEYSGVGAWDASASHSNATTSGTTNNATCGSMTVSNSNDLIACYMEISSGTFTAGTSPLAMTQRLTSTDGTVEDGDWTSSGTINPTETASASGINYGGVTVAFTSASNPPSTVRHRAWVINQ